MEIPKEIINKFFVRDDYLEWINRETLIIAYLDLTNMFHWQDVLGWKFKIEHVIEQLLDFPNMKEVRVYYGFNNRDKKISQGFHARIRKSGAILRSKPMKFIRKEINESLFFQRRTINLFDNQEEIKNKISELINTLTNSEIILEEPKCNFDVEMAMDIMDNFENISAILLFSGDSDLKEPIERLKINNKIIGILGVRGKVANEFH